MRWPVQGAGFDMQPGRIFVRYAAVRRLVRRSSDRCGERKSTERAEVDALDSRRVAEAEGKAVYWQAHKARFVERE